jgi:hypothetical protein
MPRRLLEAITTLWQRVPGMVVEFTAMAGAGAITTGAWMIHPAAGWITGGAAAIAFSVLWGIGLQRRG